VANGNYRMVTVKFIRRSGISHEVQGEEGQSVLEVSDDNDIGIEGACEGSMACSTCHVIVEERWVKKLLDPSEEEQDMLDLTYGLTPTSRLGCQIRLTQDLDGITLALPSDTHNMLE